VARARDVALRHHQTSAPISGAQQMAAPRMPHLWANDDPLKLARALKAALDQTNSRR